MFSNAMIIHVRFAKRNTNIDIENLFGSKNLECDHIVPRSLGSRHGYTFDTFENRVRAILEFLHNHNNLRTVCQTCHKRLTADYLSRRRLIHSDELDQIHLGRWIRTIEIRHTDCDQWLSNASKTG